MGCFPLAFQEVKRPLRTKSGKCPIKVGKRPIKEAKRPIKAMVLVGISVGCLMGCFRAPQPCRKTAPLKRPIKRFMILTPRDAIRKKGVQFGNPQAIHENRSIRANRFADSRKSGHLSAGFSRGVLGDMFGGGGHASWGGGVLGWRLVRFSWGLWWSSKRFVSSRRRLNRHTRAEQAKLSCLLLADQGSW